MATFANRALTLATVGLLTANPLSLATDGRMQDASGVIVVPPVVEQPRGSGGLSASTTFIDYRVSSFAKSNIQLYLVSRTTAEFLDNPPKDCTAHSAVTLLLDASVNVAQENEYLAWSKLDLTVSGEHTASVHEVSKHTVGINVSLNVRSTTEFRSPNVHSVPVNPTIGLTVGSITDYESPTTSDSSSLNRVGFVLTGSNQSESITPVVYGYRASGNVLKVAGKNTATYNDITAQSYKVSSNGGMTFTGNVRAHIEQGYNPAPQDNDFTDEDIVMIIAMLESMNG